MAKAIGVIGAISGKFGNVVYGGTTEKGEVIMRAYNPNVHNPKTARQTLSRAKFAMGVSLFRTMSSALRAGWYKNGFQKAMAIAIPAESGIINLESSDLVWNYAGLASCISRNELGLISTTAPNGETAGSVKMDVTAPDNMFLDEGGNACKCGVVVVIYCPDTNETLVATDELTKGSAKSLDIEVPIAWSGLAVQVYAFAKQIPNAKNGIPAATEPWMYPSRTSETYYSGRCELM